ncbi:MAG: PhzF family phenazine biosynthesis protein [Woeseia sp.]
MQYRYFICDVFTDRRFGGNPLAVLPDAPGLDAARMQQIAREFNFSESTFVFPMGTRCKREVRIFTPTVEVPFAGHPNIGTAFALAQDGLIGEIGNEASVIFEESAGPVAVRICRQPGDRFWCELKAPQSLSLGDPVEPAAAAAALSLQADDIVTGTHPPRVASVGLPFLLVEAASREVLRKARPDIPALARLRDAGIVPDVHLYLRTAGDFDIRSRMFAPFDGVPEDPATGSANCALAAMLAHLDTTGRQEHRWRIAQGVEMGRPSVLDARTRREGTAIDVWIGGHSVLVSEGLLYLD